MSRRQEGVTMLICAAVGVTESYLLCRNKIKNERERERERERESKIILLG